MNCIHCGKPLPGEASFCPNCGKSCTNHSEHSQQGTEFPMPEEKQKSPLDLQPDQQTGRYAASFDWVQNSPQQAARSSLIQSESPSEQTTEPHQAIFGTDQMPQSSGSRKRRMPKWLLITICATTALLVAFLILVLANPEDFKPAGANEPLSATEAPQTQTALQPKEGECLYTGSCSYFAIDNLELSFILSADKSYIYGVTIQMTNLNVSFSNGNTTTSLKISSAAESFSGQYPVDYENGTDEIELGASKISNLSFDGARAWFELDYTYVYRGTGADTQQTEIPFGTAYVELTTEDDTGNAPPAAEDPEPVSAETVFDETKLQNWNDEAFQNAFGVSDVRAFSPSDPVSMYYIVCTDGVYDPVIEKESEGGYNKSYSRHLPISTQEMLRTSGNLQNGGLTLTDDPNMATYALILNYSYTNNIGSFHFSEDDSVIPQYHATLNTELLNLVTGESIYSEMKNGYATYANESVNTSMLNAAKGKQLYGGTISLYAEDFDGYWNFIGN